MPVQSRPDDQFTRDNLLLGFSTFEFEPSLPAGGFDAPVEMGIISSQALQKEVEILELERGDSGTLTVDREIISKLKPSFAIETFNMRADVARYVFGSDITTAVVADAAAVVAGDQVTAPTGADATRKFLSLTNADIDATTALYGAAGPTNTPLPPTDTPVAPTDTPIPTATATPDGALPTPTATPEDNGPPSCPPGQARRNLC